MEKKDKKDNKEKVQVTPLHNIFEAEKELKQKRYDIIRKADEIVNEAKDAARREHDSIVAGIRAESKYEGMLADQKAKIKKEMAGAMEKELRVIQDQAEKNFNKAVQLVLNIVIAR